MGRHGPPLLPLLRSGRLALLLFLMSGVGLVQAQDEHRHQPEQTAPAPTSHLFNDLMTQAMDRMHAAMAAVPQTGRPDHDFLAAMVPHHRGAIDMAKAVLLVTTDPRIRNLAQSIITEQQYEIDLMTHLLAEMPGPPSHAKEKAR
jgi:uncharacterized protein (DUF305 family)